MATHERELTRPVDLCTPDGRRLSPDARGWSRTPLHTANLRGGWGRTKRWDYWAILTPDLAMAVTYADVDYLGLATVWWCDLRDGRTGGTEPVLPLARGVTLPDRPGSAPLRYRGQGLDLALVDDADGTMLTARWTEHGTTASLEARVELPAGHESVNVVIPWSERRFQYTSKHQARPAHGTLVVGGETHEFGGVRGEAWGVLDVGRGRWPYSTRWNWGGGAGTAADGTTVVGLQLGAKWTEGTGATENGVILDGRVTKLGDELVWDYDWSMPMIPWRVHHHDGSLDLTLAPVHDRHTRLNIGLLATEVHQVFGRWTGHVTGDDGRRVEVAGLLGFAEESRSRW
jgi:hypothetical protein